MKKLALILSMALVPAMFFSCNNREEAEAEAARRADSLQAIIDQKDGEIDALFEVLNQIEDNLTAISDRYSNVKNLNRGGIEGNTAVKGEINEQIQTIEKMLSDNKAKLSALNAKISTMGKENTKLQEFVAKLEERIASQEAQISQLTAELENNKIIIKGLNENVSNLTKSNQEKDDYIAYQTAEHNKAYYIVGSFKELKEMGIVNKSGGFIGIGKKQGTTGDMSTDKFACIDRTKVTTIAVGKKKAMLVSKHPADSYELLYDEQDPTVVSYVKILNSSSFWKYTDYLVISSK